MDPNPPLGVVLHAIGGLASAIFYLPYRRVRDWAWESYWLAGGGFSWIVAPWLIAWLMVPDLLPVLRHAPGKSVAWAYFFGALWGVGGLTFGLTVRYLGFALGTAMALGYCAAFGTLVPPIVAGEFGNVVTTSSGIIVMAGVGVCLAGIVVSALAGIAKERELPEEQKKAAVKEFSFAKGVWVATFCGIMSACMSYGFAAGKPIAAVAVEHGTAELWKNLPVLIIVLAGGFTTNLIWCLTLNFRNQTFRDYFQSERSTAGLLQDSRRRGEEAQDLGDLSRTSSPPQLGGNDESARPVPLLANYAFSALAGTIWYFQFFFYGMGTSKMGRFDFSSWTLHMASIMIFGTLVGVWLSEWNGVSRRTRSLMLGGLAVLVASTIVIGYGNSLNKASPSPESSEKMNALPKQISPTRSQRSAL